MACSRCCGSFFRHNHPNRPQSHSLLDEREYTKGKTVPEDLFKMLPLSRHSELPAWNYTIRPNCGEMLSSYAHTLSLGRAMFQVQQLFRSAPMECRTGKRLRALPANKIPTFNPHCKGRVSAASAGKRLKPVRERVPH